jgi:hypothetical protein
LLNKDVWHTEDLLHPVFMGLATKNAKVISIALGSPQRLEYLHKMLALELIEGVLTNHHELFRKVRTSSGAYFPVMFIAPGTLTFIPTPLSLLPLKTLRFPSHAPQDSRRLSLT